jgi:hypothetical protein
MDSVQDTMQALNAAANQILSVVAPATFGLAGAHVSLDEGADTAYTDGVHIWLPPTFEGLDVATTTLLAIGLLDHELGHFLQPLDAIDKAATNVGAPHWLVNVALDVQDEAMMACLFPLLANTLKIVRGAVNRVRMAEYQKGLAKAQTLIDAAGDLALAGRFGDPNEPFVAHGGIFAAAANKPWWSRAVQFLQELDNFRTCTPKDLPAAIEALLQLFPELRQAPAPPLPLGTPRVMPRGRAAGTAQGEAQTLLGDYQPSAPQLLGIVPVNRRDPPQPQAVLIARAIRPRFAARQGAITVAAPGRVNRRAAATGDPMPFRMQLAGKEKPAPNVVLCLDKSGSMAGTKLAVAVMAGQAITLAVKAAGGKVVAVAFDDVGVVASSWDDALLFADRSAWKLGGTDFGFLADVWRRYPNYWIVLLTDGAGDVPFVSPPDRERTSAVVIPDGDRDQMEIICGRVVDLADISALPYVMAMLIPRAFVA